MSILHECSSSYRHFLIATNQMKIWSSTGKSIYGVKSIRMDFITMASNPQPNFPWSSLTNPVTVLKTQLPTADKDERIFDPTSGRVYSHLVVSEIGILPARAVKDYGNVC